MSSIQIVLIAAVAANGVIGRDNDLPFKLPTDMKHFKALTLGHPVVMGRATYQSIGRPLPGRPNLVVSGDPAFRAAGCEVYRDLDVALERAAMVAEAQDKQAVFVIGGGQIYAQTIDLADRLEITHVAKVVEGGTLFPAIDPALWWESTRTDQPAGPDDEADMVFATYLRH